MRTGDDEADAIANTALFTKVIEGYARRYPEQWLWVHRRWKTRPPGEPSFTSGNISKTQKKRTAISQCAPGKGSVSLPSIANCLVCSPFRTVFLEKFKPIADKCPDRNHHGSGEPNEEQCLQKQY